MTGSSKLSLTRIDRYGLYAATSRHKILEPKERRIALVGNRIRHASRLVDENRGQGILG